MDSKPTRDESLETGSLTAPTDLGTCVAGLVNAVARGMAQIVAPHGLAHIDFALLRLFLGVEEWTTSQLAQVLPLAPSGISRTVTKLVDMGLIQRRRLLSDRRVVVLTLTEAGTALTQDLHRARPGIRRQPLPGRQRGAYGGSRLRHFKGYGELCRHGRGGGVLTVPGT